MVWLFGLVVVGLAASVGLPFVLRRRAGHVGGWSVCREGLVHFGADAVLFYPWPSVRSVEPLGVAAEPEVYLRPPFGDAVSRLAAVRATLPAGMPPETVAEARRAHRCIEARQALPTFTEPEGPAVAVLAGLSVPPFGRPAMLDRSDSCVR